MVSNRLIICPSCGLKGVKGDSPKHVAQNVACVDFMKLHGIVADEFARNVNTVTPAVKQKNGELKFGKTEIMRGR